MNKFSLIVLVFLISTKGFSQFHFYHPEIDYGSESIFNPVTLFTNGACDILRNGSYSKDIFKQPYQNGIKNVWMNISNPISNIKKYGLQKFLHREIFNITTNSNESQFLPNIGLHILGNGMQYQKLAEWYTYHQYSNPKLRSLLITTTYQFCNEIYENGEFIGCNVDPISDMLIFNPLGILLFNSEFGEKFFTQTVPIFDWSLQPYYNPHNRHIENAGQQYATKVRFGKSEYSAFLYWGLTTTCGISRSLNDSASISCSLGAVVQKLQEIHYRDARYMAPNLDYVFAIFYDRYNSLLGSFTLTGPKYITNKIEIFPGFLGIADFKPGMFICIGESEYFQFGIAFPSVPVGIIGKSITKNG